MELSDKDSIFFIAELGINHNGNFDVAQKLIDHALLAKADAIKFQYRNLERTYFNSPKEIGDEILKTEIERTFLKVSKLVELSKYAKFKNLRVGISFFDSEDIADFGDSINLFDFFKVPSVKMLDFDLINYLGKFNKPVLISTGAHSQNEINNCFKSLTFDNWFPLHCISNYPTIMENARLGYISTLQKNWGRKVGYSSHDEVVELLIPAYLFGARIFERHITLDKNEEGLDHSSSSTVEELCRIINILRKLPKALEGEGLREINRGELINRQNLGKSYHAKKLIPKGSKLNMDMLSYKSPNTGISKDELINLVGKVIERDCHIDEPLTKSHFEKEQKLDLQTIKKLDFYKVSLPTRLHDFYMLNEKFSLSNYELHLSFSEIDQLNNFSIDDKTKNFSLHLPDYQNSVSLFDPFDLKENNSQHILESIFTFTRKYFRKRNQRVTVVGSFAVYANSKDQFYIKCRELQDKFDENFAELCFQWLPPYAWYFGGSFKVQTFHNSTELNFILDNKLNICMDLSHLFLGANYFGFKSKDIISVLAPLIRHYHVANASGFDGEGMQIDQGDKQNTALILATLSEPQVKVIEVWQGHLNRFKGFFEAIKILDNKLK